MAFFTFVNRKYAYAVSLNSIYTYLIIGMQNTILKVFVMPSFCCIFVV